MFRLLGFLIGSAASIGAILLLLGVPELQRASPDLDKARFDEALEKLKEKQRELPQLAAAPAEPAPAEQAAAEAAPADSADAAGPAPPADEDPAYTGEPHADTPPQPLPAQHWHAFWNPFRSEIAARGFVAQLERVTGLDYRIVKVKTGVYEVSFAYQTDAELDLKLSQIQAATGLDLPPN